MGAPNGGNSVLFFKPEGSWGADPTMSNASSTYRMFFDSFTPNNDRTPVDFKEIQGGAAAVDHTEFVEGGIEVGGTLVYTMRYAGMHALMNGVCLGELTTGASAHSATLADDLPSIAIGWQPANEIGGATVDELHTFLGMMVQSVTWSHTAGEPLKCSINFIGKEHSFVTQASALATNSMATPAEDIVQWHDKEIDSGSDTGIEVEVEGSAPVELNCTDWEITLDNAIERRFIIQNGRKTAQPARNGKRTITARVTIDKDEAWREFQTAMGATSTTDTTDLDIRFRYEDGADSDLKWESIVANARTITVPSLVADDGFLTETIEVRAHQQTGGQNLNDPMDMLINNDDTTDWGTLIGVA